VQCEIRFSHDLPLNQSNAELAVNFLQYTESAADGSIRKRFSWVTDLKITRDNALHLVCGARARWKIENETFNTLTQHFLSGRIITSSTILGMASNICRWSSQC